ncbi:MAG: PQQ-binding-like beta-propeller repeat protein [Thermomicrobiales bacterium]
MTHVARRRAAALLIAAVVATLVVTPGTSPGIAPRASAQNGTVEAAALTCPATVDPAATDQAVFAEACVETVDGLTFSLTAGGVTRRRTTAGGEPVSWSAVSGPFTMRLEDPQAGRAVTFCASESDWQRALVEDGAIEGEVIGGGGLTCQWYLLPEAAAPTATTAPTATSAPIATATQAPTVAPTATQAPTPTLGPTATPTPPPIDLSAPGDLVMFLGNPTHAGAAAGPGPEGQPTLLWRYPLGDRVFSSPAVTNGTVYVGGDAALYALDAATGTERWRVELSGSVIASPATIAGVVFVGSEGGEFVAVDGETGAVYWRFETEGKIRSSPAIVDGIVYFTSYDGNAYALDATTGQEVWRAETGADILLSSPAIADGIVYFGVADITGGEIYAFDAETGGEEWRIDLSGPAISSPVIVGETMYIGSYDGRFYALDVANGDRRWVHPTNRPIWSSAAVVDGVVYFGGRTHELHALDAASGMELWRVPTGDWIDSPPTVADGVVYFGSKDNNLYAADAATGGLIWQLETGRYVASAPVVVGGVIYVTSRDGFIYAYGSGGQIEQRGGGLPGDVPREIVIEGGRYLLDRMLFADAGAMTPAGSLGPIRLYAQEDSTATAPIYAVVPGRADGELARYWPERLDTPEEPCPGEDPSVSPLQAGDTGYAYAGIEPLFTTSRLTSVATANDGRPTYAESAETTPIEELFLESAAGLQRFMLLDERGLPEMLRGSLPFAGGVFTFAEDATGTADRAALTRLGCAGPFPVLVSPDQAEAPFTSIFIVVGGPNDSVLAFEAT